MKFAALHKFTSVLTTVMLTLVFWTGAANTAPPVTREYSLKAAFLYNFAKFVDWPEEMFDRAQSPIVIGILGDDPFGSAMDAFKNKTVHNRPLRFKHFDTVAQIKNCHILFISRSEAHHLSDILKSIGNQPILTVGDMQSFAEQGGMIGFITVKRKIRFEINVEACQRVHLKVSANLLRLAKIVGKKQ